jgi:hypothetical protein
MLEHFKNEKEQLLKYKALFKRGITASSSINGAETTGGATPSTGWDCIIYAERYGRPSRRAGLRT